MFENNEDAVESYRFISVSNRYRFAQLGGLTFRVDTYVQAAVEQSVEAPRYKPVD